MFKFIHAADIHLDSPLRGLERYEGAPVERVRGATRRALANLVDLAIEQSVAFVLIAGDLYDGEWKEFRTGLYFVAQMVRLREAGIPVVLVAGNHDAANRMTRKLPLPDNVRVLSHQAPETVVLDEVDVAIHGQSFARTAVSENLAAGYPAARPGLFNIGLLHTAATGREGHEPYAPCTLDDLRAKEYDYWALGHIHKAETLCQQPPILFSGNLQGRQIRETGPKGCLLVTVDDRQRAAWEARALDVFRWERLSIDPAALETPHDLLDGLRERLAEVAAAAEERAVAVRVEVRGPTPAHSALAAEPERWANEIRALATDAGGGDLWIEKVVLDTSLPSGLGREHLAEGPIGELLAWIDELKSSPAGLETLGAELADLCGKLPSELREGADALRLDQPDAIRPMLQQVEELLVHQLLSRGERP